MKRPLSIALAIGILLIAATTAVGKPSPKKVVRVQQLAYQEPTFGVDFPSYQMVTCDTGCPVFDIYRGERYVTLEAEDTVSPDVALAVFPWDGATGNPRYDEHHYCTSIDESLRIPKWATRLWVEVLIGPCSDGTPAMATQGTVTATFSNLP